jgi:hypothetical protein
MKIFLAVGLRWTLPKLLHYERTMNATSLLIARRQRKQGTCKLFSLFTIFHYGFLLIPVRVEGDERRNNYFGTE